MLAVHGDVIASKKSELDKLEAKIDKGLDQTLNAVAGWVKTVLTTEQKKTDFNPGRVTIGSYFNGTCGVGASRLPRFALAPWGH